MNIIKRTKCVINDKPDLETIYSYKSFPILINCTDRPKETDKNLDLDFSISKSSGCIQLRNLVPLKELYEKYHNPGTVGKVWEDHHNSFSKFILKNNPRKILEIGGGSGILAEKVCNNDKSVNWTILEPSAKVVKKSNYEVINGYFDKDFVFDKDYECIVHSHVLEHIYEPRIFLELLNKNLNIEDIQIFSVPNMEIMFKNKYTNCITFEHTIFLTENYIEFLLTTYGFKIIEKEYFKEDHSIFYKTVRDKKVKIKELEKSNYQKNKKLLNEFISYHNELVKNLNNLLLNIEKNVYLFGACNFSQFLLEFGLKKSKIKCLLDNDVNKQGKRLYGTNLIVKSPLILREDKQPIIIVKAGAYTDEIKKDIINNINANALFLE